ncbi:MAG TPA: hypothetical protein VNC78_10930 [Actinomycetota bacterium]|nr:hypothetical protein [Actinomycetota bacterium]
MDVVGQLHRYVGYIVPAGFLLLFLWAIVSIIRNRDPGGGFWGVLAFLQVIIGIQVIVGATLFLGGLRPPPQSNAWLHYVYGGLFPAGLLVAAHVQARKREGIAVILFGIAAFLCFGLTSRALMTGLGVGV